MENGKYIAKPLNGRFGRADTGTAGVTIEFELTTGEKINWTGWLSQKAYERTIETLVRLGCSDEDLMTSEFIFNGTKEFELVIENEASQKNPDKFYPKVKFINDLGSNKFAATQPEQLNLGFNLKEAMAQARAKLGVKKTSQDQESDLPF